MIIDGETMGSKFQFQFPNEGNHTVYIKFRKDTNPEMYSTSQFFSNKEKLLSVVFSDFDEYLPDLCFDSLFSGCKNLISVDLSKIASIYGGGGHKGAAAFTLDYDGIDNLILGTINIFKDIDSTNF